MVIRPIELLPWLVNHSAPSGPAVMSCGLSMLGSVKFVMVPVVVIRPIELLPEFVNHNAPSGPAVIQNGLEIVGSV